MLHLSRCCKDAQWGQEMFCGQHEILLLIRFKRRVQCPKTADPVSEIHRTINTGVNNANIWICLGLQRFLFVILKQYLGIWTKHHSSTPWGWRGFSVLVLWVWLHTHCELLPDWITRESVPWSVAGYKSTSQRCCWRIFDGVLFVFFPSIEQRQRQQRTLLYQSKEELAKTKGERTSEAHLGHRQKKRTEDRSSSIRRDVSPCTQKARISQNSKTIFFQ